MFLRRRESLIVGIYLREQIKLIPLLNERCDALHEESIFIADHDANSVVPRTIPIGAVAQSLEGVAVLVQRCFEAVGSFAVGSHNGYSPH